MLNLNGKTPCFECNDRRIGCHSICKRYLEYKDRIREITKSREIERYVKNAIMRAKWGGR